MIGGGVVNNRKGGNINEILIKGRIIGGQYIVYMIILLLMDTSTFY